MTTVQSSLGKRAYSCDIWGADPNGTCCPHILSLPRAIIKERICKAQIELMVKVRDAIIETNRKINDEHESQFCRDFSDG